MNRLFGHFSFYSEVNPALVKKTAFKSPRWTPDYQGSFTDQAILLTSTQRFITPECHRAQMPFRHAESGCIIVADVYLTAREDLCRRLSVPCELSDAELILLSYLKWGTDLPHYLAGEFCFAIWHPKEQALFLATDQFSRRPLLYAHQPGKNFTFSNEISPFRNTCPTLTTNDNLFAHFSFNSLPKEETCYQEVFKLLPGHQLYITPKVFKKTRYWHLDKKQKTSAYKTREEYYEAFQDVFKSAVSDTLRSPYPITAHISGGLDSSSVAAQAARLLAERSRSLLGFTAKPIALEGPSYREGWVYHDMPIVQALLDRYPNIKHFTYTASPQSDIMTALQAYFPFVDQPFRNLGNMDWWLGAHDYAHENGGRVILTGTQGNGSISWAAASKK
ncbi:MAG: hypothetical protein K0U10_04845 [Gammaproteobacteria bacterium]|nr:hypothetical protein [Gammaproteobacteria bacterium]